ncbi:hypothetical protein LCGC14_2971430 [marine sediment metagenome]|uniref:NAD-dependent epimerase/dehydratase domain-containing protein n=1 Tax=marine sediment metagenome TaxID=412755 RepID=A0A0F9A0I1_9ZZZZ
MITSIIDTPPPPKFSGYHLACDKGGLKYLHSSSENELRSWQTNSIIDSNVFRACKEQNVKQIIYPSSSAVYPLDNQYKLGTIFTEKDKSTNAEGGYGWTKYIGEIQLEWLENIITAIPLIILEYCRMEYSRRKDKCLIQ